MIPAHMEQLAERAWELYDHAVANADGFVVQPSMPILYFGDSHAYRNSPLKIVTVGLNPSLKEFPADDPWQRFPSGGRGASYLSSLDAYFRTAAYEDWFASFEPILRGMGASYYAAAGSTALHTDICSPVATNPTWSKPDPRRALMPDGFELWRDLVETLAPDVVIVSVAWRHLLRLAPERPDTWPSVYVLERANPYHVRMRELSIGSHRVPVVFGRAAEKPFGTVSNRDKLTIGNEIKSALDAR